MSTRSEEAVRRFDAGFNCAQAVLLAFAPELGMEEGIAARVACAFGAGMGRKGGTCGAVSGALMAIGLRHGMSDPADQAAKEKTYKLTREFLAAFTKKHGAIECRELLGCDIGTPAGLARVRAEGLHRTVCAGLVADAAETAGRLSSRG
jgi:C_GCAxxG_C_C family probable redox protein